MRKGKAPLEEGVHEGLKERNMYVFRTCVGI